jgi:hypothetical protein
MTAFNFRRRQTRRRWAAGSTVVAALGVLFVAVFVVTPAFATRSANPAASLDQCANDPAPSPPTNGCSGATGENGWVNGNLGSSKAVYREGDSIPYRLTFSNLATTGPHHVIIEWDTTKSSKHALDYIDNYNQSVANANPCLGVSGCSGSPNMFAIPGDPQITGFTPNAGSFSLWGGTITGVQAPSKVGSTTCNSTNTLGNYCYSAGTGFSGDKSAAIQVNFTATVANPVLAWGGHIATRQNWGNGAAAVNIPGSPYHTRLIDLDGSGGNQDRSLSAEAVIFPGFLHVVKNSGTSTATFGYTASPSPLSNFSIATTGNPGTGEQDFDDIETFQTYTVNESTIPSHWAFDSLVCSVASGTGNGGSVTYSGTPKTTASIVMKEGEEWTCTYVNHHTVNSTSIGTTLSATTGSVGDTVTDSATLTGATADAGGSVTYTMYTDTSCTQNAVDLGTVTVTNGSVPDSNATAGLDAGDYYFQAVYTPDANNSAATSTCTSEHLVISPNNPSVSTAQDLLPNDSMTITGATSNAGGTITFSLYAPSDSACSGTPAYTTTASVSGNGTYSTLNTTFHATTTGTWRWLVVYGGDTNNTTQTSTCGTEQFTIANS